MHPILHLRSISRFGIIGYRIRRMRKIFQHIRKKSAGNRPDYRIRHIVRELFSHHQEKPRSKARCGEMTNTIHVLFCCDNYRLFSIRFVMTCPHLYPRPCMFSLRLRKNLRCVTQSMLRRFVFLLRAAIYLLFVLHLYHCEKNLSMSLIKISSRHKKL